MVTVTGLQSVVMRGGFRLAPGVQIELPEDVADDAVRAGFAMYVLPPAPAPKRTKRRSDDA